MRIINFFYILGKILTFPGAYLKGYWEHLTCRMLKIPVESKGYLNLNETCGHVEQDIAPTVWKKYLAATASGFANAVLGFVMAIGGVVGLYYLGVTPSKSLPMFIFYVATSYLGVSMLCNIAPMVETALFLWEGVYGKGSKNFVAKILLFIPTVITVVWAYLERYTLTVLANLAIVLLLVFTV